MPTAGGCPALCVLLCTDWSSGISALVRAIDAAAQAGSTGQDTVPGGARPGCVTIMTIHRSKGLQFPVVFVADTARHFNLPTLTSRCCCTGLYGAGLRLRPEEGEGAYKTAAYTALASVHARKRAVSRCAFYMWR